MHPNAALVYRRSLTFAIGIKPDTKKVQGIIDLCKPETEKEMKSLIGMIQFYRDMWRRQSHILSPLKQRRIRKVK